jgi:hypothetical protein
MPTYGKARFGKKRVEGCECDYRYTCRKCLDALLPTPSPSSPPDEKKFTEGVDKR